MPGLASTRKVARSFLFFAPSLYGLLHSRARSEAQYLLRIPHEPDYRALTLVRGAAPLVLDVGANIGQSIFSIKSVLPDARIISFEPNPRHLASLKKLEYRFRDVTVCGVGLGAEPLMSTLYIPVYRGKAMTALASLNEREARSWLGPDTLFWYSDARLRLEQVPVRIEALDSFDLRPDFIKIDAQGAERDVLQGGLETIRRSRPLVMAESLGESDLVSQLVRTDGYRLLEYAHGAFREPAGNINRFLVPEELLS